MSTRRFLIVTLALMMLVAGCGTKKDQDTKAPAQPQVGIIDMNKAVKAHPKYNQFLTLEKQANTIAAKVEQAAITQQNQSNQTMPEMPQGNMAELNKAFEQEYNEKMAVKQNEMNTRLAAKEAALHKTLSEELKVYSEEVDKEFQPQIFNLQLKLKTVQLTKEETTSLQGQLETLQTQYAKKMDEKQAQLVKQMEQAMAPEQAAVQEELGAYSNQLNQELSKQAAAKEAEIAVRSTQQTTIPDSTKLVDDDLSQQLEMKQQEMRALQDSIIENIKDKTGKVAVERGFEAVLTNALVNVSGVDITDAVIAECNK
ncbi:molecular chaperone Skp [Pelosinus sp. IPA-1]|uniref:molecular chaperone Skp n=1 Tax=Pelosinus sp. IPA-1 TaxID=3029569 RepID=UPI002553092E|nr:molecular chaperone Skp [Pelosinus sp. IPA-1]